MEKQLTIEDFYNKYTTEHNQVLLKTLKEGISPDDMCSFGGCMYETFGEEVEYVKQVPNNRIWTVVDGDGDDLIIIAGYHFVNRLGYLITNEAWEDEYEEYICD
jgi:calcineurin-like phosphoesterase family protein